MECKISQPASARFYYSELEAQSGTSRALKTPYLSAPRPSPLGAKVPGRAFGAIRKPSLSLPAEAGVSFEGRSPRLSGLLPDSTRFDAKKNEKNEKNEKKREKKGEKRKKKGEKKGKNGNGAEGAPRARPVLYTITTNSNNK